MFRLDKPIMVTRSETFGMGTAINNEVYGKQAKKALEEAIKGIARLEGELSRFVPGSEISRINRSAGVKFERLSHDTYKVLSSAVEFSRNCQGLFDVTIGPLVTLWNIGRDNCKPPEASSIRRALPLVDFTGLLLDPCTKTAKLQRVGQSVDLGGIGKGYAADRIIEIYRKYEVSSAFTNFGGNVAVLGTKPDGSPWRVGIRHPRKENSLIGLVSVADRSVVTSGDYQRYFVGSDGKRYHHILDPFTGYPAESGLISATIVADSSMDADALSTVLFTAGMKEGIELLGAFPGTEAVLVDTNLMVYITQGLKDSFRATEEINVEILN